jgi:hypothetical protein
MLMLDKERELVEAQAEIKALKVSDRMKEKAVEEVQHLGLDPGNSNSLRSAWLYSWNFFVFLWSSPASWYLEI